MSMLGVVTDCKKRGLKWKEEGRMTKREKERSKKQGRKKRG